MRNQTLRRRITTAFVLMAIVLCGFFSFAAYIAVEISEAQLIDHRLAKEASRLIDQHRYHITPAPEERNFFVNEQIPEPFRDLREGLHEVITNGKEITVVIREVDGNRYAVTDDTSDFEITEILIFMSLAAGFIASVLLAVILGATFSRRIMAPVTELADAVSKDEEPSALPSQEKQDEIGMLSRAFAARTKRLQEFLADEKLFTGDVSHELRTPLTIILGAAELLEARLASEQDKEAAARIRRTANEATERVSALLLLSQSPQSISTQPLSMLHVVEREIDRYRPLIEHKNVTICLTCKQDAYIPARAELAGIAIGNLIRNACQYTDQGRIEILLTAWQLVIEDSGPGIPHAVRNRLFERFVRGDNQHVGSGLGLAIVKRVTDHLGWQIRYENSTLGGSRFLLDFRTTK
ncbi:two-component sensor histidine kinase [Oxalicibacterium flavum]|uniref:histidine kinase n=1 Tax=Oxalicibacterium flavum TaxID=179467 RepID=A0A8J2XY47_9BURK|nr:HAMP domain-containing sensor histidine kinase [Oxalicibacterium flavum]GGC09031.1 two-component sensor histidine kinase [Oxalicibacterium flavum]